MANVKQGNLTGAREWWQHLRHFGKREFWKGERQAHKVAIQDDVAETRRSRMIDRTPTINEAGDTVWPDSETPNVELSGRRRRSA